MANLDRLQRFPNQNAENRSTECVGESVADIVGNIYNQPMDAGFSFAAAFKVSNTIPTTAGVDSYSGMLGNIVYGCLPTSSEPFDATTMGELYEANFDNYPSNTKLLARNFSLRGVKQLLTYDDVCNYLMEYKMGVSLTIRFYESFLTPLQNGVLPSVKGNYTIHDCAIYEDTLLGLRVKMYLGPNYGDKGYVYLTRTTFDLIFVSAFAFDPYAWKWMSLAMIGSSRWWMIRDVLPLMVNSR